MAVFWRRAVLLLVLIVAVLQIIHMALLSRLESKRNERRRNRSVRVVKGDSVLKIQDYHQADIEADRKRMLKAVEESSVLDASGEYHIINFLIRAQSLGPRNHIRQDITLVTQSSVSQLHHLETLVSRWHGLISVAVFALSQDLPFAIEAILKFRQCSPIIRYNTSFHLVYPLNVPSPAIGATTMPPKPSIQNIQDFNCNNLRDIINMMQPGVVNYALGGVPYPNNLLRNVARRNCLTEFVFMIDIDLVPNNGLHHSFIKFASVNKLFSKSSGEDKTVYVVPAYEMQHTSDDLIPHDKAELLKMVEAMTARPFYYELCWKCQKHTDYDTWQRDQAFSELNVLFEVLWRDPWEPFYISRNSAPMYDERFRQYGFNRISQVCELHMAGYKFSVLNNAFVVHKGLKTVDSFHTEKDLEQERNRGLFRQFKTELKDRYPNSSRRCY